MKRSTEARPAEFVHARMSNERISALWTGMERSAGARRVLRARTRTAAVVAGLAGALALGVASGAIRDAQQFASRAASSLFVGDAPASKPAPGEGAPRQLSLADGSSLSFTLDTRAHVVAMTPSEVRVRLERGQVECEVTHNPSRLFAIEAGGFEVVVRGTHFIVAIGPERSTERDSEPAADSSPERNAGRAAEPSSASSAETTAALGISVSVARGSVEIRKGLDQTVALLGAGESLRLRHAAWTATAPAPEQPAPASHQQENGHGLALPR